MHRTHYKASADHTEKKLQSNLMKYNCVYVVVQGVLRDTYLSRPNVYLRNPMMPSEQRQTADKLVQAFNALDTEAIISLRTPECSRIFLPTTLNLAPQSNEIYLRELNSLKTIFTTFKITVHDIIEGTSDDGSVKMVMYVSAEGQTVVGEYKNEYVLEDGF